MSQSSMDSIILPQFKEKFAPVIEKIHFMQPETGKVRLSVSPEQLSRSIDKPLVFIEPLAIAVQMYDREIRLCPLQCALCTFEKG